MSQPAVRSTNAWSGESVLEGAGSFSGSEGELGRSSEMEVAADKRRFALHCDASLGSEANWFIQGFG